METYTHRVGKQSSTHHEKLNSTRAGSPGKAFQSELDYNPTVVDGHGKSTIRV